MRIHPTDSARKRSTNHDGIRRQYRLSRRGFIRLKRCASNHRVAILMSTALILTVRNCKTMAKNFTIINKFPIFKNFKKVVLQDITLLGAPVLEGRAVYSALNDTIAPFKKPIVRISTLRVHAARRLFNNSLAKPKLRCILGNLPEKTVFSYTS